MNRYCKEELVDLIIAACQQCRDFGNLDLMINVYSKHKVNLYANDELNRRVISRLNKTTLKSMLAMIIE